MDMQFHIFLTLHILPLFLDHFFCSLPPYLDPVGALYGALWTKTSTLSLFPGQNFIIFIRKYVSIA